MHLFRLTLLIFLLSISGHSFGQFAWQKTYGLPNLGESLDFIYPAAEPGCFWAAGKITSVGHDDVLVVKLDSMGHILWADTLGSAMHNEFLWCFHREPTTGDLYLAGSRANFEGTETRGFLMKLSADGGVAWEIISPMAVHETTGYVSVVGLPDGGATAVLHETPYGRGQLLRLDANGNVLYSEALANSGSVSSFSQMLAALPDGRFYLYRNVGSPSQSTSRAELSLRASDGQVLWTKDIEIPNGEGITTTQNMAADPGDGSAYVLTRQSGNGNIYLTSVDVTGEQDWTVYPLQSRNMLVRLVTDSTVALISDRNIDVRAINDGSRRVLRDFSDGEFYWDRRIRDACFRPAGRGAFVGEAFLNSSYTNYGSYDAYFGYFETETDDMALLRDAYIGTYGPSGDDLWPHVAQAGGSIFLASHFEAPDSLSVDIQLRKVDPVDGAEHWANTFSGPLRDNLGSILAASDGMLLLVSDTRRVTTGMAAEEEVVIRKLDPSDGTVIWEKRVPNPQPYYGPRAAATDDGGVVVVFHGQATDPEGGALAYQYKALRLSAEGDILWQTWIEPTWSSTISTTQRSIEDLIELRDGDFLAVGMEEGRSGLVLRIDGATGSAQAISLLDPESASHVRRVKGAVETAGGDLLLVAPNTSVSPGADSVLLYRLAPDGSIRLRKGLQLADWHEGTRLLQDADGGLFLLISYFYVVSSAPAGLVLRNIDENFETLAETELYDFRWQPNSAAMLTDGSIAIVREATLTNSRDLWLAKTEGLPSVGTAELSMGSFGFIVSPNPIGSGENLQLTFEDRYLGILDVEFIAPDGRRRASFPLEKTAYFQVFELDDLPQGHSFWIRISNGRTSTTRLVVRP